MVTRQKLDSFSILRLKNGGVDDFLKSQKTWHEVVPLTKEAEKGEEIARLLSASESKEITQSQVINCIVGYDVANGNYHVAVVPSGTEVEFSKISEIYGSTTNIAQVSRNQLINEGFDVGALSPTRFIGKKKAAFYIDSRVIDQEIIYISSGNRRFQIKMKSADLKQVLRAKEFGITSSA